MFTRIVGWTGNKHSSYIEFVIKKCATEIGEEKPYDCTTLSIIKLMIDTGNPSLFFTKNNPFGIYIGLSKHSDDIYIIKFLNNISIEIPQEACDIYINVANKSSMWLIMDEIRLEFPKFLMLKYVMFTNQVICDIYNIIIHKFCLLHCYDIHTKK